MERAIGRALLGFFVGVPLCVGIILLLGWGIAWVYVPHVGWEIAYEFGVVSFVYLFVSFYVMLIVRWWLRD